MLTIDLNADLGENEPDRIVSDDASMLDVVSSANVSCGFHAGTATGIRSTLRAAVKRGVVVGAHPSYRDHAGFGRRDLEVTDAVLQADVEKQLGRLIDAARDADAEVAYVKPHGALYNRIARDERRAGIVVAAIRAVDPRLIMLGLAGGVALRVAERAGLATASEAFADRALRADGTLVPRGEPGAVLDDPGVVAERMLSLVERGTIRSVDGAEVRVQAHSICVHGDSQGAVTMAQAVRRVLQDAGVRIAPFAGAAG